MGLYNLIFNNKTNFENYLNAVNAVCSSDYMKKVAYELAGKCYKIYESAITLEDKLLAIRLPIEIANNYGMTYYFDIKCKYYILEDKTHKTVYVKMEYKRGNKTMYKKLEITLEKTRLVKKFKPKIETLINMWSD